MPKSDIKRKRRFECVKERIVPFLMPISVISRDTAQCEGISGTPSPVLSKDNIYFHLQKG